jgi:hypothetical protein
VLLALWLDNVLPAPHRPPRRLLYFLDPAYWMPGWGGGHGTQAARNALDAAEAAALAQPPAAAAAGHAGGAGMGAPGSAQVAPDDACGQAGGPEARHGCAADDDVAAEELEVQRLCR